ncbi:hypothetical protein [Deinococcus aquatilis]|uniref:hypothetical protein n=1 Tax=Deinococcus aquatilis TaxID=519440 RepID=UPI00037DF661|nr:hypothetical protein [Deinococcus aquatilis]
MPRELQRGQTQVLYRYLPEAIFDHDDFGLCRVTTIELDPLEEDSLNDIALFDAIGDAVGQWTDTFRTRFPDVRDPAKRMGRFRIGQPRAVGFTPYPENVQCRKCGYVTAYADVERKGSRRAQCPRHGCSGTMKQLRYVEAHNCGRVQELNLPRNERCPSCGGTEAKLYDPGRTALARWVCVKCDGQIRSLRMTPCKCEYSEDAKKQNRPNHERYMRVYPTGEPGLYNPLVVTFINFRKSDEQRLRDTPDAESLLLARAWGVLDGKVLDLAREREQWVGGNAAKDEMNRQIVEALRKADPGNALVKQYDDKVNNPPGQDAINQVTTHLGMALGGAPSRRLIEHVALRDNMRLTTPQLVAERLTDRGEAVRGSEFLDGAQKAMQSLGLCTVEAVEDFPIAQAAFGYTRVTKDPRRSSVNPFMADEDGRLPLYTLPTETEALWFQLDPVKVASWLVRNQIVAGPAPTDPTAAWAWLWRTALRDPNVAPGELTPAAEAVQTLLHSISHIMLQRMEWSGYASSSIGEYLLPETLSFALYANRFTESKIGGLLTLFEQRLPLWLHEAGQQGRDCIYDPICAHDGSSCAGCLYREHNCVHFNKYLSRALLYGGPLPQHAGFGKGRITHGYWTSWTESGDR